MFISIGIFNPTLQTSNTLCARPYPPVTHKTQLVENRLRFHPIPADFHSSFLFSLIMSSLAIQIFAAVGALYLFTKVFSFIRLLFSLFILPGTSVSTHIRK